MKKLVLVFVGLFFLSIGTSSYSSKDVVVRDCVNETFDFYESLEGSPLDDSEITCLGNGYLAVCMGYDWDGSC